MTVPCNLIQEISDGGDYELKTGYYLYVSGNIIKSAHCDHLVRSQNSKLQRQWGSMEHSLVVSLNQPPDPSHSVLHL